VLWIDCMKKQFFRLLVHYVILQSSFAHGYTFRVVNKTADILTVEIAVHELLTIPSKKITLNPNTYKKVTVGKAGCLSTIRVENAQNSRENTAIGLPFGMCFSGRIYLRKKFKQRDKIKSEALVKPAPSMLLAQPQSVFDRYEIKVTKKAP
jgi:hypothetical protein